MIPGSANPLLLASAAEAGAYQISRSVRFNSSDSAYLSRVPSTAGNRKVFTLSFWVKRSQVDAGFNTVFSAGGNQFVVRFTASVIEIYYFDGSVYQLQLITNAVYRDPSAWYHFLLACNTDAATPSDRTKLCINGSQVISFSTATYPSSGLSFPVNNTVAHYIGTNTVAYLNAYLADFHLVDGQALDPTSFGEFDANGVWQPKAYTGTYGTNGFHLPFSDNSTAAALGTDTSGNGNDWTVNNFAVTPVNSYQITGFDATNGGGAFANSTLPASGDSTNSYHFPKTNNTYTLSKTLTATTKIEAYCYIDGNSGPTIQANGGSVIAIPAGSGYAWSKVNLGVTSLSSITLNAASWPGSDFWLSCFIVDDVVVYGTPALAAGNDSLVDTPTNYGTDTGAGGEVRGNYATLNPLDNGGSTILNGNLEHTSTTTAWKSTRGTFGIASGKWYWEGLFTAGGTPNASGIGFALSTASLTSYAGHTGSWGYLESGFIRANGSSSISYGATYTTGDIIGIALDLDAGTCAFYKNGASQGQAFSGLSGTFFPFSDTYNNSKWVLNFGQRPFAYTAPSGFKALCTTNLPDPQTITTSGSYTGNGVADGPFVYLNGVPTAMTVNGNAVTFGTYADKLSNGFKIRTTTYNQNASTYNYSITSTGDPFKTARAQSN